MPVSASKLSLLKLSRVGPALGAEVERDRNSNIALERRSFPLRLRFPLVLLFEGLAFRRHVGGCKRSPA